MKVLRIAAVAAALVLGASSADANWRFERSRAVGEFAKLTKGSDSVFVVCEQSQLRIGFRFQRIPERELRRGGMTQVPDLSNVRFIVETERGFRFVRTASVRQLTPQWEPTWFGSEDLTGGEVAALGQTRRILISVEPRYRQFFRTPQAIWESGDVRAAFQRVASRSGCRVPDAANVAQR